MRASQNSANGFAAAFGQSSGASQGPSHSTNSNAGTTSPLGIANVSFSGALKFTALSARPPVVTSNGVL